MKNFQNVIRSYPLISRAVIFPVALFIVFEILSILIEFVLPILIAALVTNSIFNKIIGKSYFDTFSDPYSFIQTKFYTNK